MAAREKKRRVRYVGDLSEQGQIPIFPLQKPEERISGGAWAGTRL